MRNIMTSLYFQPSGFLYGNEALEAKAKGLAVSLAGQTIAFSMVTLIERDNKQEKRTLYRVEALVNSSDPVILEKLKALTQPRSDIKALSFEQPLIMGVLNVTPDSFSDGGQFDCAHQAIEQGKTLFEQGADIVDIGGESTRPGADDVGAKVETQRVLPVLEGVSQFGLCSIDSRRAGVMEAALNAGAGIINDVTALSYDERSIAVAQAHDGPIILMHSRIKPENETLDMAQNPSYDNVSLDIYDYLEQRIECCVQAGIAKQRLIIDPGIGFGKTFADNIALLQNISVFHGLGVPILVGLSRKRFIGVISKEDDALKRDPGSSALSLEMIRQGVQIVRVHNVANMKQVLRCFIAIRH